MQVLLNGNSEVVEENLNLLEFIQKKGLHPETIIVEYNERILKQEEWSRITLQEKDSLEVLNFVGGG